MIAPDGTIVYTYTSLDPRLHVQNTLNALKAWGSRPRAGFALNRVVFSEELLRAR